LGPEATKLNFLEYFNMPVDQLVLLKGDLYVAHLSNAPNFVGRFRFRPNCAAPAS
jgi:hypothetical protein